MYVSISVLSRSWSDADCLCCRINFSDSHEIIYRTFEIAKLPPPEGMKVNELRYASELGLMTVGLMTELQCNYVTSYGMTYVLAM